VLLSALAFAACGSASQNEDDPQAAQSTQGDSAVPAAQSSTNEAAPESAPAETKPASSDPQPESAPEQAKAVASDEQADSSGGSSPDFAQKVQVGPEIEFAGIASWINSEPLTLAGLKGNVVLVDFWTYTCINCQRTLPYVKSWHDKYADEGLVVIGMHSPEFTFEKQREGVVQAAKEFGLEYPIAQDNEFVNWQAFKNAYWPTKYLIDRNGVIRYTHIGEGAYDQTELMIQTLLAEPGA
jgi:thiol-disulfide isomerase/thioredoxin